VELTGKISSQTGCEKYLFGDGTGTVVLDIDDKRWRGLSVGPDDVVVVRGEVDRDLGKIEIDVRSVTKQ
jgi:uncharacterized protein (TIGR00156 family)